MSYREQAVTLLKGLDAVVDDFNIKLVSLVFQNLKDARDDEWEEMLNDGTNEALTVDNTRCLGCGAPIQVVRKANIVKVLC